MEPENSKVWVITGASTGLGKELALTVLSRGDRVIGTSRSDGTLSDIEKAHPHTFRFLQLDINDAIESINSKAKVAASTWGRIDVVVNNAGYSVVGTIEESRVEGFLDQYKTNIFGSVNVTNAFLPYMRATRSGTVVFIGSRSGWRTNFLANGIYGSSKAALHAIADALGEEIKPFGIKVLTVVPGGLRTENINRVEAIPGTPLSTGDRPPEEVPEYASIRSLVGDYLEKTHGTQSGDPRKAASVIADVVRGEGVATGRQWPGTLFLGSDSVRDVKEKCEVTLRNLAEWGAVATSIDVDV